MGVEAWSTTPALNVSVGGVSIAEGCPAGNLNDALRAIMAELKTWTLQQGVDLPISIAQGGTGQTTAAAGRDALLALDVAYRQLPQSAKAAGFSFDLTQGAGHVYYVGAAATATIPPQASVAFPLGTAIVIVNSGSGALAIARGSGVELKLAGTGANADRSLAAGGMATLLKVAGDTWYISGAGLT